MTDRGVNEQLRRIIERVQFVNDGAYADGTNVEIFLNGHWVTDATALEYTVTENVLPIYSYNRRLYDALAVGQRIAQGQFVINYTTPALIASMMNIESTLEDSIYATDDFANTNNYGFGSARILGPVTYDSSGSIYGGEFKDIFSSGVILFKGVITPINLQTELLSKNVLDSTEITNISDSEQARQIATMKNDIWLQEGYTVGIPTNSQLSDLPLFKYEATNPGTIPQTEWSTQDAPKFIVLVAGEYSGVMYSPLNLVGEILPECVTEAITPFNDKINLKEMLPLRKNAYDVDRLDKANIISAEDLAKLESSAANALWGEPSPTTNIMKGGNESLFNSNHGTVRNLQGINDCGLKIIYRHNMKSRHIKVLSNISITGFQEMINLEGQPCSEVYTFIANHFYAGTDEGTLIQEYKKQIEDISKDGVTPASTIQSIQPKLEDNAAVNASNSESNLTPDIPNLENDPGVIIDPSNGKSPPVESW